MSHELKRSGAILGGYLYQNMIGLEQLCNWLDDPTLFKWVVFEADREVAPQGLDDLVACRPDDKLILLQVKFTVDPSNSSNRLSWDWLLGHKPTGRSLLQKWSKAAFSIGLESLHEVALITNRIPDRDLAACIDPSTSRLDLTRADDLTRKTVQQQLGSEGLASSFLERFEFRHSHQNYLALKRTLRDRFIPRHTNTHGWNALFAEAIDWAVRDGYPSPDGRILIDRLRGTIDSRRPEPLVQSFQVPEGYAPPDEAFTDDLVERIVTATTTAIVLWGSPGQGKSTFLSYLSSHLAKQGVPYVRHHYFLNLFDASERFSLPSVANSLMAQMEAHHSDQIQGIGTAPEKLREWLSQCAEGYLAEGKRFVVIIDGLDHVWRENDRNREPLDRLFQFLLPVPPNLTLVLGTQRVADSQLPTRISTHIAGKDWIELPRMSLTAIKRWLAAQLDAHRFGIPRSNKTPTADPLPGLAEQFHRASAGHPLYLTYSFEALVRENFELTADLVGALPDCPGNDIRAYYRALWNGLSFAAKDALHLVADAGFIWPLQGLETCLAVRAGILGREISHLFDTTDAGQVPFHGSLLAFVREDAEHDGRVAARLPQVVSWLADEAPEFLRWGWLWLTQARLNNPTDLVGRPDRKWVIDSLARGYPVQQVLEILGTAERLAFGSNEFARALRLRLLKNRVRYGPDFQVGDYMRVRHCALRLAEDEYPLLMLAAQSRSSSIDELHLIAMEYVAQGRLSEAYECQSHILQRLNDHIEARTFDKAALEEGCQQFLDVVAATGSYNPALLAASVRDMGEIGPSMFAFFLGRLSAKRDIQLALAFVGQSISLEMRRDLEATLVRIAGTSQAALHQWPEFAEFTNHPLPCCWALLYARDLYRKPDIDRGIGTLDTKFRSELVDGATESYLHTAFFAVVATTLELDGADDNLSGPVFVNRMHMNDIMSRIYDVARAVARVLARGSVPPFDMPYRMVAATPIPTDYDARSDYTCFRRAMLSIAADLFLLGSLKRGHAQLNATEWSGVVASPHFMTSEWQAHYVNGGYDYLPADLIQALLEKQLAAVAASVSPFNERTDEYVELCELATAHSFKELSHASLRKSIDCTLGYGWHKDLTLATVVDALQVLAAVDATATRALLTKVCPFIARVTDITDGDETRHTKAEMAELLRILMPRSFVAYYGELMRESEWYDADGVLGYALRHEDLAAPMARLVGTGLWDEASLRILRTRMAAGDTDAAHLLTVNAAHFGLPVDTVGVESQYTSATADDELNIDVSAYDPPHVQLLIDEMNDRKAYVAQRRVMREWFAYWTAKGSGPALLRALEPYRASDEMPSGVVEVLDDAFELCRLLEGADRAYRWLVTAHIQLNGWDPFYTGDAATIRIGKVAQYYPSRWREFLNDTSKARYHGASESLIIPGYRLVQLFAALGDTGMAVATVEAMVESLVEDVADQPLSTPAWLSGD